MADCENEALLALMFERQFSHYVTYGATDQVTIRELSESFDGLVVPGTVASFQKAGTGGFVLSLSATDQAPEYVIDPRFPLFQQALGLSPKKSHVALAEIVGEPDLVKENSPSPDEFDDGAVDRIAEGWAIFNTGYTKDAISKFSKYEKRLQQEIAPHNAKRPVCVLPPYFVSKRGSPWWELSKKIFAKTAEKVGGKNSCIRVIATESAADLNELLEEVGDTQVAIWVSGLNEMTAEPEELSRYLRAIARSAKRGTKCFALYGGFFSVLASGASLRGACHGIGFGEHRSWIELPQSGPPPTRYYLPQVHRYVSQEQAYLLWREDHRLAECDCPECGSKSPIELEYHELMKHSVHCRSREIDSWVGLSLTDMAEKLRSEDEMFRERLEETGLARRQKDQLVRYASHLDCWAVAIEAVVVD